MSESDSGVDTGTESSESNSMSVESPPQVVEEKYLIEDHASRKIMVAENVSLPGASHSEITLPVQSYFGVLGDKKRDMTYNYQVYKQYNHTCKMKSGIQKKSVSKLKQKHSYPRLCDIFGEWKLRKAVVSNSIDQVKFCLDKGVDPCVADEKDRTPLHLAASLGHADIVNLLIERGADPNQRDVLGNTPLHLAACTSHIETVTLLLKAGTDVNAFNKLGRSPLHLAQSKLKVLQMSKSYSSAQLKNEVMQVLEMMQVYLQRSGQSSEVDLLNAFSNRLQHHQTREEVNLDVSDLLNSLSHLSL